MLSVGCRIVFRCSWHAHRFLAPVSKFLNLKFQHRELVSILCVSFGLTTICRTAVWNIMIHYCFRSGAIVKGGNIPATLQESWGLIGKKKLILHFRNQVSFQRQTTWAYCVMELLCTSGMYEHCLRSLTFSSEGFIFPPRNWFEESTNSMLRFLWWPRIISLIDFTPTDVPAPECDVCLHPNRFFTSQLKAHSSWKLETAQRSCLHRRCRSSVPLTTSASLLDEWQRWTATPSSYGPNLFLLQHRTRFLVPAQMELLLWPADLLPDAVTSNFPQTPKYLHLRDYPQLTATVCVQSRNIGFIWPLCGGSVRKLARVARPAVGPTAMKPDFSISSSSSTHHPISRD